MSEIEDKTREADARVDAIAATAIITLAVFSVYLWLKGMPGM